MKSKLNVEYDFDNSEPYIQLTVDFANAPEERSDMRDTVLKNFVERAVRHGVEVIYPQNTPPDSPQLRIVKPTPINPYVPPIDWRQEIENNHVKINAKYQQVYGEDDFYQNGESYNLMFGICEDNFVMVKYGGSIAKKGDGFIKYKNLSQFLEYWTVNPTT